jgi:predicted phage baseplate assembly protein
MTIPALRLDDLTWAQMMEAIRQRIPAASQGRWTLHAPVGPGITMLELYAWLLEQRLYLLDQVPDGLVRGVLALLGVPAPQPAVPAATVLALRPTAGHDDPPAAVAAGTELHRSLGGRRVVFTTEQTVALVPPGPLRLLVGGIDLTADLDALAGGVDLLPAMTVASCTAGATAQPPPVELVLTVPAVFDPPAGAWLDLLLELETSPRVPPAWSPAAPGNVPPPAPLTWSYEAAPGRFEPFQAPGELDDGTGGLRRAGIVRLAWPAAWRPGASPAGTVERRVRITAGRAAFSAPPRLRSLAVNAVIARHRQRVRPDGDALERLDAQLDRWLSLPGQDLHLDGAAGQLMDDPASVCLTLTERDSTEHAWQATGDLGEHGPPDRVFVIDRAQGRLRFGDGRTGRLPVVARRAPGSPPRLSLRYELGGGQDANLGIVEWVCDAEPVEATSAVTSRFGQEPETIEQARQRAADELGRPVRAVTAGDYQQIAQATPGVDVARVHVAIGRHPATPCDPVPGAVMVVIVPGVPRGQLGGGPEIDAPVPDPGAVEAVRANLETARLLGTEIFVRGPTYRVVRLAVTPGATLADPAGLHRRLLDGLRRYLDPLTGGADSQGWPFGEPVRPSELLGVAQGLAGRTVAIDAVAVGLDGAAPIEACHDAAIGAHELVVLRDLTLAAAPARSGNGELA